MDHVAADEQGNSKPTLFNRDALQLVDRVHVDDIDHRADTSGTQAVAVPQRRISALRMDLAHLADLLGQRHLSEQRPGAGRRIAARVRLYYVEIAHRYLFLAVALLATIDSVVNLLQDRGGV